MGTARTSPKVVRERRRKGIQPRRGRVRRHFPRSRRNERNLELRAHEAKAWVLGADALEQVVTRLLASANVPAPLVEDVTQDLWVKLLEGQAEEQLREDLDLVVSDAKKVEWGGTLTISLDRRLGHSSSARPVSDYIDQDGKTYNNGSRKRSDLWRWRMDRRGIPHTDGTKRLMSKRRVRIWAGEYGEQRRLALKCAEMICRHCGYDGPLGNFAKNPNSYQGRDKICKPCMSAKVQEHKRRSRERAARGLTNVLQRMAT